MSNGQNTFAEEHRIVEFVAKCKIPSQSVARYL